MFLKDIIEIHWINEGKKLSMIDFNGQAKLHIELCQYSVVQSSHYPHYLERL